LYIRQSESKTGIEERVRILLDKRGINITFGLEEAGSIWRNRAQQVNISKPESPVP
jgi:hypothetical protein